MEYTVKPFLNQVPFVRSERRAALPVVLERILMVCLCMLLLQASPL